MISNNLAKEHKEFIEEKRKEYAAELMAYLKKSKHHLTMAEILEMVYCENDEDDFEHFVMHLAGGAGGDTEQAQELAMALFNYFPRESLGKKSLAEKMSFDELKNMERNFQDFRNGTPASDYKYRLPPH